MPVLIQMMRDMMSFKEISQRAMRLFLVADVVRDNLLGGLVTGF